MLQIILHVLGICEMNTVKSGCSMYKCHMGVQLTSIVFTTPLGSIVTLEVFMGTLQMTKSFLGGNEHHFSFVYHNPQLKACY